MRTDRKQSTTYFFIFFKLTNAYFLWVFSVFTRLNNNTTITTLSFQPPVTNFYFFAIIFLYYKVFFDCNTISSRVNVPKAICIFLLWQYSVHFVLRYYSTFLHKFVLCLHDLPTKASFLSYTSLSAFWLNYGQCAVQAYCSSTKLPILRLSSLIKAPKSPLKLTFAFYALFTSFQGRPTCSVPAANKI